MDQFQTLSYLQMALNTNAIFTVATFFILWVAFRFAGKMREGESTMLGRVLTTVFGLMIIWTGLLVGASRNLSFNSAANGLKAIKASGQTLSAQAEAFLTIPQVSSATTTAQFSLFSHLLAGSDGHAFICNLDACASQEVQLIFEIFISEGVI
jgi:hypothetical protein